MNLADRIKAELDRLHDTDTFSIAAYDLLGEALLVIKQADDNFKSIASLADGLEQSVNKLENTIAARRQA